MKYKCAPLVLLHFFLTEVNCYVLNKGILSYTYNFSLSDSCFVDIPYYRYRHIWAGSMFNNLGSWSAAWRQLLDIWVGSTKSYPESNKPVSLPMSNTSWLHVELLRCLATTYPWASSRSTHYLSRVSHEHTALGLKMMLGICMVPHLSK